jgi:uncharacterized membrane protein
MTIVMRAGVLLGAAAIAVGVLLLALSGSTGYGQALPHGLGALLSLPPPGSRGHFPTTPGAALGGALDGKPYAVIELGIMLLIATPVARVALGAALFACERDWLYVTVTAVVLAVLVLSHFTGAGG